jgi:uncharacterized protein (TIGR03435 family)
MRFSAVSLLQGIWPSSVLDFRLPLAFNLTLYRRALYVVRMKPIVGALILSLLWIPASAAPLQQKPSFEVASIKQNTMSNGARGGCRGSDSRIAANDPMLRSSVPLGRCVITAARLSHLLNMAYGIPLQRIFGLPDWDGPNRFDIEGKAEDATSTTEQQLIAMLQGYLTEQFHLRLHRDVKEEPTFNLLVGKNGPKSLRKSDSNSASMIPNGASLVFTGYTMDAFAQFLTSLPTVARPVKNMTSLEGTFDFKLDVLDAKADDIGELKMAISRWETITSDIQQQLNLHLESSKGPVETLVVDHAEKPAMN